MIDGRNWAEDTYNRDPKLAADDPDEMAEDVGELLIADYLVFLFALDTFMRYIEERTWMPVSDDEPGGDAGLDALLRKGLSLLRRADRVAFAELDRIIREGLTSPGAMKMLDVAMRTTPTARGASVRALRIRTLLTRGGPATAKRIFDKNPRARKEVFDAIEAGMMLDADAALAKLSIITLKNKLLSGWIDLASDAAIPLTAPTTNPVQEAAKKATQQATDLRTSTMIKDGTDPASEEASQETAKEQDTLQVIETEAREAAQKILQKSGEEDRPVTKSEAIGIATAAAAAVSADPDNDQNIPESLRKLDSEQRAAALTDGRVLVAAGAGAGKTTTLIARIRYLVQDRRATPSRIFVTSFNQKAANEIKARIAQGLGEDTLKQMSAGTMHSLFRRFVMEYGLPAERSALENGFQQGGGAIAGAVNRAWSQCYGDKSAPKAKDMMRFKSQWSGNGISPAQAKAEASTRDEKQAAEWYEWYEGFKGTTPNWSPPCRPREWETFMSRKRQGGRLRLADFDDMLTMFRDVLKRNPGVRKTVQQMFDHIMVDECQDLNQVQNDIVMMMSEHIGDGTDGKSLWMVGDDKQCVHEDTPVATPNGDVRAGDLKPGAQVLANRNGKIVPQTVRHIVESSWDHGLKITTDGGHTLTISPNHKIWASSPTTDGQGEVAVYLMYRRDLGFRVGITNKGKTDKRGADYFNSYGGRAFMEKAERMWVLDICIDREAALLKEARYSLQYGIPTTVFNGETRGINQGRINSLFQEFGRNGSKLLEDRHLSFDHPHWMSQSYTKHGRDRRTVHLIAHSPSNTQVALEWSGDDLDAALVGQFKRVDDRRRIRRWFASYRDALSYATELSRASGASLRESLSTPEERLHLFTASGLFPGMRVAVLDTPETGIVLETITSVERAAGKFVDLDVDDASNFFGGGILSHNSIYGFRGARPELFVGLDGAPGWKTRMIRTNYRCQPEIVEAANKLIANNEKQIPMEANPDPKKSRGVASIRVQTPLDESSAAINTIREIKLDAMAGGAEQADYTKYAILTRTNKEQHAYETACIIKGVPYARKGTASFFGSPETNAVLSYVQLATGDDCVKMQAAMAAVLNKPNRFFIAPDAAAEALKSAFSTYAVRNGLDIKTVNPVGALADRGFRQSLAQKLTGQSYGFKFDKTIEKLAELGDMLAEMRTNATNPEYKMKDLFGDILNLRGIEGVTDPRTGKTNYVDKSFRDTLMADLKNATGGDDDDDEREEDEDPFSQGLGNVAFLFELAKPDPDDPEDGINDPATPMGFKAKMERYAARMRDLRIDVLKWEKEHPGVPPPGVYVGTVHSVKGAQWQNTYVAMPKGKFPMEPRVKPGEENLPPEVQEKLEAQRAEQMEQERRLGYVALTRAINNLTVICPSSVNGKAAGVSAFIDEAGLNPGENVVKAEGTPKEASVDFWSLPRGASVEIDSVYAPAPMMPTEEPLSTETTDAYYSYGR